MSKLLKYEVQDNIAQIRLSNGDRFNLVGKAFLEELLEIQNAIISSPALKAVTILADGKHFSAGIDLNYLQTASSKVMKSVLTSYQDIYSFWEKLPIPVIVGVQGKCIGSAVEMILGCDIRVLADDAEISLPEVKIGLSPDMGGTARLTKLVGTGQAKRLIMACDEIGAEEAVRIGLAEVVVEREQLETAVMKYAKKMSRFPQSAIRFSKRGIQVAQESSLAASLYYEEAQSVYCCGTEDLHESISAMVEKRLPNYKGE